MPARRHPDGGVCAGTGSGGCTIEVASVWSGREGGPRYCKSKQCIELGKARGHIGERSRKRRPAESPQPLDEESGASSTTELPTTDWWPITIEYISSSRHALPPLPPRCPIDSPLAACPDAAGSARPKA
jgi:hypothetical protein